MSDHHFGIAAYRAFMEGRYGSLAGDLSFRITYVTECEETQEQLRALEVPDLHVVPSLDLAHILSRETSLGVSCHAGPIGADVLDRMTIINLHGSRLPKYRGPDPHAWQVRHGVTPIGLTAHIIEERLDRGWLVGNGELEVDPKQTWSAFEQGLSRELGKLLARCLQPDYEMPLTPLVPEPGSYFPQTPIPLAMEEEATVEEIRDYLNRPLVALATSHHATFVQMKEAIARLCENHAVELYLANDDQVAALNAKLPGLPYVAYNSYESFVRLNQKKLGYKWVGLVGPSACAFLAFANCMRHSHRTIYIPDDPPAWMSEREHDYARKTLASLAGETCSFDELERIDTAAE